MRTRKVKLARRIVRCHFNILLSCVNVADFSYMGQVRDWLQYTRDRIRFNERYNQIPF